MESGIFHLNLGFDVMGIRSVHKAADQDEGVEDFNDAPETVQILITSLKIASSALNLHHCCCDMVFAYVVILIALSITT